MREDIQGCSNLMKFLKLMIVLSKKKYFLMIYIWMFTSLSLIFKWLSPPLSTHTHNKENLKKNTKSSAKKMLFLKEQSSRRGF